MWEVQMWNPEDGEWRTIACLWSHYDVGVVLSDCALDHAGGRVLFRVW